MFKIGDLVCTHKHDLVGVVSEIRNKRVTLVVLWNKPPRMQGCKTCIIHEDELELLQRGTQVIKHFKKYDDSISYRLYDAVTGIIHGDVGCFTAWNLDGSCDLEFVFEDDMTVFEDVSTKNNKQYTTLDIEPWDIMQADFTREEFIGFLKGNIIKYCLRKKGSDLQDFEKIEHYAKKLQEILKNEN